MEFKSCVTWKEIIQQPSIWREEVEIIKEKLPEISRFLDGIKENKIKVIFTGAGSSEFVGNTISSYINSKVDIEVVSIPTTDIVSMPEQYLNKDTATILISCARSGNSPESVATVELADKLVEDHMTESGVEVATADGWTNEELMEYIIKNNIVCPKCGKMNYTDIRKFNLMFKTFQGITEDSANTVYLRPETAQGIFVNFKSVQRTSRKKVPFGIAQIGKSFRNEITPGNFTFRTREFEQMELEFFCKPGTDLEWFGYWKDYCWNFLLNLGVNADSLRMRDHGEEELSFYSNATSDIEYLFPFGWGELWGIADRTDYDLKKHAEHSGTDMSYLDPTTNEKYIPYCIEPSLGADRVALAFLVDAYDEEELEGGDVRTVMHLHPALAPYKAAVLPLSKKLSDKADEVYSMLAKNFNVEYDETGSIGKRYRRQDEIGTPFCITVDFETENDGCVTIRHRDSMTQERVEISKLTDFIAKSLEF